MKYVGLSDYSRYGNRFAMKREEIRDIAGKDKIIVAVNLVREADEILGAVEGLDAYGFIVNELSAIKALSQKYRVFSSVGLTPLNFLDVGFLRELGAHAVTLPPELNCEVEEVRCGDVKIEVFGRALVEMFYKGKCLISAYACGKSVKRDGVCMKECCRKWDVIFRNKRVSSTRFVPKLVEFDVKADFVKFEGRQFGSKIAEVKEWS